MFCDCFLQPVLEEEKSKSEKNGVGVNGSLSNTYVTSEFSKAYKACYSNGSTNGFVSQSMSEKKVD